MNAANGTETRAHTVRIQFTSGREVMCGPFDTKAAADAHVAMVDTWAYVARIWVLPSSDTGASR